MKWLKMRNKWAHGYNKWEYIPISDERAKDKEYIESEIIEEEANRWSYSDKYRGIDWEIIPTRQVPNTKIIDTLDSSKRRIENLKIAIESEKRKVEIISSLVGKGRKTDPDEIEAEKRRKRIEKIKRRNASLAQR